MQGEGGKGAGPLASIIAKDVFATTKLFKQNILDSLIASQERIKYTKLMVKKLLFVDFKICNFPTFIKKPRDT